MRKKPLYIWKCNTAWAVSLTTCLSLMVFDSSLSMGSSRFANSWDYGDTFGVLMVRVVIAFFLLGVEWYQVFHYLFQYQKDPRYFCYGTLLVVVVSTSHQVVVTQAIFSPLSYRSVLAEVMFNGLNGLLVKFSLASRVWSLSKNKYHLTMIVTLVIAEFACIIAFSVPIR
ncbi:hypothetical protein K435DRAFT_807013 [Dendrothele bispora CBS 962.96]|uniref:Uncharacterized protein n=1 Tax=Dendrothele bispora (strain CBS 962.96) TaxID=1314807 RepID=A0A4S8L7D3_DENBC|nr:hypothetical protein K435DRAFT_807013 [Dendrothele bispora CBS 962.96]